MDLVTFVGNFKVVFTVDTRYFHRSRNTIIGIATGYGVDGPGIESRWRRDFPHPSRPALRPHPASYTMGTGSFRGVKWPVHGVDHLPPSSAEVKERVELYFYSPSGLSWPVLE